MSCNTCAPHAHILGSCRYVSFVELQGSFTYVSVESRIYAWHVTRATHSCTRACATHAHMWVSFLRNVRQFLPTHILRRFCCICRVMQHTKERAKKHKSLLRRYGVLSRMYRALLLINAAFKPSHTGIFMTRIFMT